MSYSFTLPGHKLTNCFQNKICGQFTPQYREAVQKMRLRPKKKKKPAKTNQSEKDKSIKIQIIE